MSGTWWGVVWGVVIVGGWAGNQMRSALRTRHERQMERDAVADRRKAALEAAQRPPQPVCGCTHHLAKHDKDGKCHATVEMPVEWDAQRNPTRFEARQCDCQRYVGPEPLTTLYAQEITDQT